MNKLSDNQKVEVVNDYLDGLNCAEIAQKYKVTKQCIRQLLKRRKIKIRTWRKYELNQSFFENIDTEEKAYFLGILYADGCNIETRYQISLSLQEEDKEILERLNRLIFKDKPLGYITRKDKRKNMHIIRINSQKISKDLARWGCVQNKTFKIEFPTFLKDDLIRHFIRGILDGDGCIVSDKANITSTTQFCQQAALSIYRQIGITPRVYHEISAKIGISYLSVKGRFRLKLFLDWIYKDAKIYMERKYKKYLELLLWKPKSRRLKNNDGKEMGEEERRLHRNNQYKRYYLVKRTNRLEDEKIATSIIS